MCSTQLQTGELLEGLGEGSRKASEEPKNNMVKPLNAATFPKPERLTLLILTSWIGSGLRAKIKTPFYPP